MSNKPAPQWPNLQDLIDTAGSISVGYVPPIPCAAVASDEDTMYAALVKRPGETLTDLLDRLDVAVEKAIDEQLYTDEINN